MPYTGIYTPVVQTQYLPQGLFSQKKFAALMASGALDVATASLTAKGGDFVSVPKYVQAAAFERVATDTVSDVKTSFVGFSTNDGKVPVLRQSSKNKYYKHALAMAGEDFGQKIALSIGNKLAKRSIQVIDLSLQGVLNVGSKPHLLDISAEATKTLTVTAVQRARAKMGDNADQLSTMLIHSRPWNSLMVDLITNYKYAGVWSGELINNGALENILGCRNVIISDDLAPESATTGSSNADDYFYTYLMAEGALYYSFQQDPYVDVWEDPTNDDTIHYEKIACDFVAAPRAFSISTANPTDANLATSGLWTAAYEDHRNFGVVSVKTLAD